MSNVVLSNTPTKPKLGTTVLYSTTEGAELVAMVIGVNAGEGDGYTADLHVMGPGGCLFRPRVPFGEGHDSWRWLG